MARIQSGTAVLARMKVALTRPDLDVNVEKAPAAYRKCRSVAVEHRTVVNEACVCAAGVLSDPLTNRRPFDLFFTIACESHVDGKRSLRSEPPHGFEQHEQLTLVVGCPTPIDPAVTYVERKGVCVPQVKRIWRLYIEVTVEEYGWSGLRTHVRRALRRSSVARHPPSQHPRRRT